MHLKVHFVKHWRVGTATQPTVPKQNYLTSWEWDSVLQIGPLNVQYVRTNLNYQLKFKKQQFWCYVTAPLFGSIPF